MLVVLGVLLILGLATGQIHAASASIAGHDTPIAVIDTALHGSGRYADRPSGSASVSGRCSG